MAATDLRLQFADLCERDERVASQGAAGLLTRGVAPARERDSCLCLRCRSRRCPGDPRRCGDPVAPHGRRAAGRLGTSSGPAEQPFQNGPGSRAVFNRRRVEAARSSRAAVRASLMRSTFRHNNAAPAVANAADQNGIGSSLSSYSVRACLMRNRWRTPAQGALRGAGVRDVGGKALRFSRGHPTAGSTN